MMTETLNREIEYYTWKRYKVEQHLKFLDDCKHNDVYPNFCRIPQKTTNRLMLRPHNTIQIQERIFNSAYDTHIYNLTHYEHKLNTLYNFLLEQNPNPSKFFSIIKSKIIKSEYSNDMQRHKKLENLIKSKKQKFDLPTVLIHNLSEINLPENISKILMKGIHQPVGGRTNKNSILTQFEGFFDSWQKNTHSNTLYTLHKYF